jgi:uridine phosphorylase
VFGGAGCLDKDIAFGKIMIPTESYRDEGTSFHYMEASDYVRIKNFKIVEEFLNQLIFHMY